MSNNLTKKQQHNQLPTTAHFTFFLHELIYKHILRYFVRRADYSVILIIIGFEIFNHYCYDYYYKLKFCLK